METERRHVDLPRREIDDSGDLTPDTIDEHISADDLRDVVGRDHQIGAEVNRGNMSRDGVRYATVAASGTTVMQVNCLNGAAAPIRPYD